MPSLMKTILPVCFLAAGSALWAADGSYGMLDKLESGQWAVISRDGGPARTLCLGNRAQLIQLRHAGSACSRYVVENGADKVTVQYTCKRNGYGRTSIRRETPTLLQIESQGIADGRPFQFRAEARRTGACR